MQVNFVRALHLHSVRQRKGIGVKGKHKFVEGVGYKTAEGEAYQEGNAKQKACSQRLQLIIFWVFVKALKVMLQVHFLESSLSGQELKLVSAPAKSQVTFHWACDMQLD